VYFPLGGSRVKSVGRLLFNMFVVWSLTGLWHGAAWTYALWGVGFFAILAFERLTGLNKWMEKHAVGHVYAMLAVVTITVMIRSVNLGSAGVFYGSMFGLSGAAFWDATTKVFLREYGVFLVAAVVCGMPIADGLRTKLHIPDGALRIAGAVGLVAMTGIAMSYLAVVDYNPFIYFNF
jgi:alginate O-acetyltransferase complex protein AlgI